MIHSGKQVPVIKKHEPDYKTHAAEQEFVFEPGRDVSEKFQDCEFIVFGFWFIVYRSLSSTILYKLEDVFYRKEF